MVGDFYLGEKQVTGCAGDEEGAPQVQRGARHFPHSIFGRAFPPLGVFHSEPSVQNMAI